MTCQNLNRGLRVVFVSDSEYLWLLLIQTLISYELNPIILGTFTWQNGIVAEVVGEAYAWKEEVMKRFSCVDQ